MGQIPEATLLNPEDESSLFQKSVSIYKIKWYQNPEHYTSNDHILESYIWQWTDTTILIGRNANAPKEHGVWCSLLISCHIKLHYGPLFLCSYNSEMNNSRFIIWNQDLQKTNPVLSNYIADQESRPEVSTKLMSLLIAPIQRIPRYRLLLKQVISHTPTSHPDYSVLLGNYSTSVTQRRTKERVLNGTHKAYIPIYIDF